MEYTFIWNRAEAVKLCFENSAYGDIIKICNNKNTVFALTSKHYVLSGNIEMQDECNNLLNLKKLYSNVIDIACNTNFFYYVEKNGNVFRIFHELGSREEIILRNDSRCCLHGYRENGSKVKVKHISVGNFGSLFVTENGQLWASGNMPQININNTEPQRVIFFEGRKVHNVAVGNDFAIALVRKNSKFVNEDVETDSECSEDVFVSSCPHCNSTVSSSVSQNSLSDASPCNLNVCKHSLDASTNSSPRQQQLDNESQKSKEYASSTTETHSNSLSSETDSSKQIINSLENLTCQESENDPVENGAVSETESEHEVKKNIIFRNTEAAREFLTRQFSWVSVGEEYLAECTEAPTRIIKQNVSTMANLVYEGVKTVGDKVVTLSRHVSGSSDTNDALETYEEIYAEDFKQIMSNLNLSGKFDDLPWSSSSGTSEKDFSEQEIIDRTNILVKSGNVLLSTEVWTWGNNNHGQLGAGDTIKRAKPILVSKLTGLGIQKIVCGKFHSAALSLDGRAFVWGRNDSQQINTDTKDDQSAPKAILVDGERIKDVACGEAHTLLFTYDFNLYFLGRFPNKNTEKTYRLTLDAEEALLNSIDCDKLEVENRISKNRIMSSGELSLCVRKSPRPSRTREYLALEQKFLESLLLVQSAILKQLQKKIASVTSDWTIYETLFRYYSDICHFTAANVLSWIEFIDNHIPDNNVLMIQNIEEHICMYKHYLNSVCNVVSVGGFNLLSKLIDIPNYISQIFSEYLPSKKSKKSSEVILSVIFQNPLQRINNYKAVIQLMIDMSFSMDKTKLSEALSKWDHLLDEHNKRQKEADFTKHFWESSGKVIELLRSPERRLIRESRSNPLLLLNSSHFSSHWFVLLTDVFIHLNGTSQTVYSLPTIWIEPLQDTDYIHNAIMLTMPEDTLTLYTSLPQYKTEWLQSIQNAIKMSLKKTNVHQPPAIRTASYTFVKNGFFKDAKYSGRWLNGKMHGMGTLDWPDGRTYCGQIHNSMLHGFGRMDTPNVGVYEGRWKDNFQNGSGVMRYASGDIYEGNFKDGQPHGHGVLKQGHFMASLASVYIGEWVSGVKQGYGVMDNISSGEKYLGNWLDNKKHGCGLIVTLDGIYYEGEFSQDVLTGHGIMIFEDGTHYEGEFRAAGIFNGKGILTLSSGDKIEGTLNGAWNEGVKISTATLHMKIADMVCENTKPVSFGQICVTPDQKWKAIFKQCYQAMGVCENTKISDAVTQKVWQNVAVLISNSHQNGGLNRCSSGQNLGSVDHLDTIPQFGRNNLTNECYAEIQQYLLKAFESLHHPLGSLLIEITAAYTATYGGVRVHPLLLNHAVAELRSITNRIYQVVRLLFPALPGPGVDVILNDNSESVVNAAALLHPILLPKVHSALFVLYSLHNKKQDDLYWKRLLKWNKQPDSTLMAFLGIDQKFCINNTAISPNTNEKLSVAREHLFKVAVETLQQLKTTFSPVEKLFVIRQTFEKMTEAVQMSVEKTYLWTMDDLLPVFHFIVIRARILQLGTEIHFIEDFMEPYLQNGELGIMFTTLKACHYQILQEKVNIND